MLLTIRVHHHDRCCTCDVHLAADPSATVADLARAALRQACPPGGPSEAGASERPRTPAPALDVAPVVTQGDRVLDGSAALIRCGLTDGEVVDVVAPGAGPWPGPRPGGAPCGSAPAAEGAAVTVSISGGVRAGTGTVLGPGTHVIGRGGIAPADPTVSANHAVLDVGTDGAVHLADAGSRNGTWCGGRWITDRVRVALPTTVRLGATILTVAPPGAGDALSAPRPSPRHGTGGVPFNRPPRAEPPAPGPPLEPPGPPTVEGPGLPVGIVSVVAPVVVGLVMVVALGSVLYGLFALLGPVMLVGGAAEARRRRRRGSRRDAAHHRKQVAAFGEEVDRRRTAHRRHLEALAPDPAQIVHRGASASPQLWERRPGHADHLHLRLGTGPVCWDPPLAGGRPLDPSTREILRSAATLADAPVVVDLRDGGVVGLAGHRDAALALARSLVLQACTHQGPADLAVAVAVGEGRGADWDWAKWLPHTDDPRRGRRLTAVGRAEVEALLGGAAGDPDHHPTLLLVVDGADLLHGRRAPARTALRGGRGPVTGLVVAAGPEQLPASCTVVVELLDAHGLARVHRLARGGSTEEVLAAGTTAATAARAARSLAAFTDPEADDPSASLPPSVGLATLLDPAPIDATTIGRRWAAAETSPAGGAAAPIGATDDGPLLVDLDADGPHALVAGTTGAGKSELLRTLVTSLAANLPPELLTFVLVDFKGGSAFDRCAELPHVVGVVTDLDAHLARRALRCLDAEIRRREQALRASGADDLAAHRRSGAAEPLPRLVVVIDEVATLKAELPGFVESLVGVAQRGRSLGMHLVLATQRPSGTISDDIRANTDLRIALRVQDRAESDDVVGVPAAADIGRDQRGRAVARLGPGEVVPFQTALATGPADLGDGPQVALGAFTLSGAGGPPGSGGTASGVDTRPTTLDLVVAAAGAAHRARGGAAPWRPWPDPLPAVVDLHPTGPGGAPGGPGTPGTPGHHDPPIVFALGDDPDGQRRTREGWDPGKGGLALVGPPGSGTTTACRSLVLALATALPPSAVTVHLLDMGGGGLDPLHRLPQVASAIGGADRERQFRLVRMLRGELARRQAAGGAEAGPLVVLVLDGTAAFRAAWDDALLGVAEDLERVVTDGPEVGIATVLTADRAAALPAPVASALQQRWEFGAGDPLAGACPTAAFDGVVPPPGRAVTAAGREVQVAVPAGGAEAAADAVAARWAHLPGPPDRGVRALPPAVAPSEVAGHATVSLAGCTLPVGIGGDDVRPCAVHLRPGEHLLVAGPARSGRSSFLLGLAAVACAEVPDLLLVAVAGPRSPLAGIAADDLPAPGGPTGVAVIATPRPDGALGRAAAEAGDGRPVLVLVDDAERVEDTDGSLHRLSTAAPSGLHLVVAGRNDALRAAYGHWTAGVRISHLAVLLQPDVDLDGDLAGSVLPRRCAAAMVAGRGYLLDGATTSLVHVLGPAPRRSPSGPSVRPSASAVPFPSSGDGYGGQAADPGGPTPWRTP